MEDLVALLAEEMHVDDKTAFLLKAGLFDALDGHVTVGEMYCENLTVNQYKNEIQRAQNALNKLADVLKKIGRNHCITLESQYYAANERDKAMLSLAFQSGEERDAERSSIEVAVERFQRMIDYDLNGIRSPGTGNARRQGSEYVAGIERLARTFTQHFPNNELSSSQTSKFYKYVKIWFEHVLHAGPIDPWRHIENTLKDPNVRLRHV